MSLFGKFKVEILTQPANTSCDLRDPKQQLIADSENKILKK